MPTIAFAIPLAPGRTEDFRGAQQRFAIQRRAEFEASRERLGVTSERGFVQHTPGGDLALIVFEVVAPSATFQGLGTSLEPLDVDFRAYVLNVFGVDLTKPPATPPAELVFDWSAP